jgi:hypothetical protein
MGCNKKDLGDIISQFILDLLEKNIAHHTIRNPQAYLSTAFRRKLIDHYRKVRIKKNSFDSLEASQINAGKMTKKDILTDLSINFNK